jgi:D-3-phosphoglycerate dehydrogenase
MKILILCDFKEEIILKMQAFADITHKLPCSENDFSASEVINLLSKEQYEILVVDATPITREIIESSKSLKLIVCTRGNPVNVDSEHCVKKGIVLTNAPGRNANSVAEFVIGMMINLIRNLPQAISRLYSGELLIDGNVEDSIRAGKDIHDVIWRTDKLKVIPYFEFMGGELLQKNLGLIGFGAVGKLVAKKALAFDMNVLVYDPYYKGDPFPGIEFMDLGKLAEKADIISLHAKDTPDTMGMIGENFFSKVKNGAYMVNTARGRLVDRAALIAALNSGKLAGAALDVFDYEPLCKDDPLVKHPKIICTPHIGGASRDVITQHSLKAFESIQGYVKGEKNIPFRYA